MIRSTQLFSLILLGYSSQFAFAQSAQTDKKPTSFSSTVVNSSWNGGTGNWNAAGDWTPNAVPNNGAGNIYNVTIGSGGSYTVNLNLNATVGSLALGATTGNSTLQNLSGTGQTLEITGGTTVNSTGILNFANSSVLKFDGGLTNSGLFALNASTATITGTAAFNLGTCFPCSGREFLSNNSVMTVNGNITNSGALNTGYSPFGTAGGNTLKVNGNVTNNGDVNINGNLFGGSTGDTLTVTGTFTNTGFGAGLVLSSKSSASIGTLNNSGLLGISTGTSLNLTNQPNGITDVSVNARLDIEGTFTAGSANALAKLTSVEGQLTLGNGQTTSITPGGSPATLTFGFSSYGTVVSGTTLKVNGNLVNSGTLFYTAAGSTVEVIGNLANPGSFRTAEGSTLNVSGNFTNSGPLNMDGNSVDGGGGDTLTVAGTLTNSPGGSFNLVDNSKDVVNVGLLSNSGSLYIGTGTLLNLTNQPNGITDVPAGSSLTVNGTFTAGSANPLAKLSSIEGSFTLGNGQTLHDTPAARPLTVAPSGNLILNNAGTILFVDGGLNDGGGITVGNGAALNVLSGSLKTAPQSSGGFLVIDNGSLSIAGVLNNSGSFYLRNGSAGTMTSATFNSAGAAYISGASRMTVNGNLANSGTFYTGNSSQVGGGNTLQVNGNFTNNAAFTMLGNTYTGGGDTLTVTGKLTNTSGASVTLYDNSEDVSNLASFSNAGTISAGAGTTLNLTKSTTNTNTGTINIGSPAKLSINAGAITLSGSGAVFLSNNSVITGAASTNVFTNASTIAGSGNIGNGAIGFINKGIVLANQSTPLVINPSSAGFKNTGTLNVAANDTLQITGPANSFLNYSSSTHTLTGGTYVVAGTLQFDNAYILTNAANITLTGPNAKIIDQSGNRALRMFTTNASTGSFTIASGRTQVEFGGSFTNYGLMNIGAGTTFRVGNNRVMSVPVNYAQVAGTTEVDGTLTSAASNTTPTLTVSGGMLDGAGTVNYTVLDSSGLVQPGDSATRTAALKVNGPYTQSAGGALNIDLAGKTPGTQYDQLNITGAAGVNGTLNVKLVNGFTPAVGTQFDILNAASLAGTFSTVNGLSINSKEHFTIAYNSNDVVLTVASGPAAAPGYRLTATRIASVPAHANPVFASAPAAHVLPALPHTPLNPALRNRHKLECGLNLLSLVGSNPKSVMKNLMNPASQAGYIFYGGTRFQP